MSEDTEAIGILNIPTTTKYWLVRANGGKYSTDFNENGFISLDHDEVTIKSIAHNDSPKTLNGETDIRLLYQQKYPDKSKHWQTTAAKQCSEFVYSMKTGDVVITPGKNTDYLSIGVIAGDPYDADRTVLNRKAEMHKSRLINYVVSENIKRRPVTWIKTIGRNSLPGELYWMLSAHQAVFDISKYDEHIDPLLFPLYQKADQLHLSVHTTTDADLTLAQWRGITALGNTDEVENSDKILMQADVHCPGVIQLIASVANQQALLEALKTLTALAATGGITWGSIYGVLLLLMGKDGRKVGLLVWASTIFGTIRNERLKNKIENEELMAKEKQLSEVQKAVAEIKPKIIDDGTAIAKGTPLPDQKDDDNSPEEAKSSKNKKTEKRATDDKHEQ
ncbi:hypothetical protein LROSL1_1158 [Furfurilactobacillus rossiae]|uniref:hypothetical protein n=1 Tax=Furfurilactobacillus rossiae TaxID=231049 RepID=UPI0015B94545|nr:hypothetical protein [Furfurilactobacillus rossiae]QLE63975.1 hypothetical protein LROSL1_1158 [Furfurilactobacillus rossiae]